MRSAWRFSICVLALAALGACASSPEPDVDQPRRHGHRGHGDGGPPDGPGGGAGGGPRHGPNVFISPAGQPFRTGPDQPYPSAVWFAAADQDHDGKLTRAEFRRDAEAFFHALDTDHDGVIDGSEVGAYERAVAPEIIQGFRPAAEGGGGGGGGGGHGGGRGGHGGGRHGGGMGGGGGSGGRGGSGGKSAAAQPADTRPQGAAWFSLLNIPEPVASTDRDLNGSITLKEFLAAMDNRFDQLDTGRRGYLTLDALPETPVQRLRR
jgi:hypothetical protein